MRMMFILHVPFTLLATISLDWHSAAAASTYSNDTAGDDSAYYRQQLHNGRVWTGKYGNISGHEFFLTEAFMEGSVIVSGNKFE